MKLKNKWVRYAVVFCSVFLVDLFSHGINLYGVNAAEFHPGAGLAIAIFLIYRKDGIVPILFALLISHPLGRILFIDEQLWISSLFGSIVSLADVAFVLIFGVLIDRFESYSVSRITEGISYLFSTILASFIFAAIVSTAYISINTGSLFLPKLFSYFIGHLSGTIIIGSLVLFTGEYETGDDFNKEPLLNSIIFIGIFSLFSSLIFGPIGGEYYYFTHRYLFIIFFFVAAYMFSFRMILILVLVYYITLHGIYIEHLTSMQGEIIFQANIFLYLLVIVSGLSRILVLELRIKNKEIEYSNMHLEDIVASTFSLLQIGEQKHLSGELRDQNYLTELFDVAKKVFHNYDRASCYLGGTEFVEYVAAEGYEVDVLNNFKFRVEDFRWSVEQPDHVVNSTKMVQHNLKNTYDDFIDKVGTEIQESILFTLFISDGVVGGMCFDIDMHSKKKFTERDFTNFKAFQRIMNNFYETRNLLKKTTSLRDDIVLSLIRTLELYDQYTGGHSEEVANLGRMISQRMNLSEVIQSKVYWAGIVHDIGKVGIPPEILNKPERLSLEEYETIKSHPIFGYEILKRSEDLKEIALLVKHHHEWWNGAGYPDGLKGKEIPFEASIISVVDAVSSMATKRPYTQIKSSNEILKEIELYKGSQFNPVVADAMIEFIKDGSLDKFYLENNED